MSTNSRRSLRLAMLTVIAAATLFLTAGWRPYFVTPDGTAPTAVSPESRPAGTGRKLVVCFGFADLENGVVALHPSAAGPGGGRAGPRKRCRRCRRGAAPPGRPTRQRRVAEARAAVDAATVQLATAQKEPARHRHKLAEQEAAIKAAHFRVTSSRHALLGEENAVRIQSIGRSRDDPVAVEEAAAAADKVSELEAAEKAEVEKLADMQLDDPTTGIASARANLATMQAHLVQAERTLDEYTLRAPQAGKVLRLFVSPGELVTVPAKKPALQFCPDGPRIIRAEVDQAFAHGCKSACPRSSRTTSAGASRGKRMSCTVSDWYTQRRSSRTIPCNSRMSARWNASSPWNRTRRSCASASAFRATILEGGPGHNGISDRRGRKAGEPSP